MTSILFVCLANICRSPALEATLRHLVVEAGMDKKFKIDSCGLGWYHLGERPDPRTFEAAKERGIVIDHQAQQFEDRFFDEFDYVMAADSEVASSLRARAQGKQKEKIYMATDFSKRYRGQPIPDPYYLSQNGFIPLVTQKLAAGPSQSPSVGTIVTSPVFENTGDVTIDQPMELSLRPSGQLLSHERYIDVMEMIIDSCQGLLSHLQEKKS